jgi:hypothetical protein
MLLIAALCLIAKLALVCDSCYIGIWGVDNFDWNLVGIGVLTRFLKQIAFTTAHFIYILFLVQLPNCQ